MWATVPNNVYYHAGDIANLFLKSKYNDICFDGSDLLLKVKEYLMTKHKYDDRVRLSDEYIQHLTEDLLKYFSEGNKIHV
jgi:hypothetical protein